MDNYTVIQDTRERNPWDFEKFGLKQYVGKLSAGDYSIMGHEDKIIIERKFSTGELYTNLIKKYTVFKKELNKLATFDEKYLILEFPLSYMLSFPANSGIPQKHWRKLNANSQFLMSRLESLNDYNITIVFNDSRLMAELKVLEIFNEYIKRHT